MPRDDGYSVNDYVQTPGGEWIHKSKLGPTTQQVNPVSYTTSNLNAANLTSLLPKNIQESIAGNNGMLWKSGLQTRQMTSGKNPGYSEWQNTSDPGVSKKYSGYQQIDPYQMDSAGNYSSKYGDMLKTAGIAAGDPRLNSVFKYDPEYGLLANTNFWDKLRGGAVQKLDAENSNFFDKYGTSVLGSLALGGAGFAPAFFAGAQTLQNGGGLGDLLKNYAFSKLGGSIGKSIGSGISSSIGGNLGKTLGGIGGNFGGGALVNLIRGKKINPTGLLLSSIYNSRKRK